jgi:hypothetical protein
MSHFDDWKGTDEGLPAAISASFKGLLKQADDEQELLLLLRQPRHRPPDSTGLTLERAAILKVLCNAYLVKRFEAILPSDSALVDAPDASAAS